MHMYNSYAFDTSNRFDVWELCKTMVILRIHLCCAILDNICF